MHEHINLTSSPVQIVHAAVTEPVHDSSGQEHGFWWSIEKVRLVARESDHFGRSYAQAHKIRWSNVRYMRKRPGQRMQGTALIVQIEQAVMVVGVRICGSWFDLAVTVSGDRRSFIYIERMVVYQRDDARRLREHKEAQHAGAQPADRSHERHGIRIAPRRIVREPAAVRLRQTCHRAKLFQSGIRRHAPAAAGRSVRFDLDGRMRDPRSADAALMKLVSRCTARHDKMSCGRLPWCSSENLLGGGAVPNFKNLAPKDRYSRI
jgi:hypothetical protein